jgi:hypothetical protein
VTAEEAAASRGQSDDPDRFGAFDDPYLLLV